MGDLQNKLTKDILIYKLLPLLDGRDGAHLSETCKFLRIIIQNLAENHVLSRRIFNHIIYLKSVRDFPQIPEYYYKYGGQPNFQEIPGEDQHCFLYNNSTFVVINNFYSKHSPFEGVYWDETIQYFKKYNYKWKLIDYPSVTDGRFCISPIYRVYIHRGSCIWVEIPIEKQNKKQKI